MTARTLDQFYTNPEIAAALMRALGDLKLTPPTLWLEPSAGSGSFFNILPTPKIGLDLDPKTETIDRANFLVWYPPNNQRIWTVGNPPFGKNSSLALKFFNHAALFSEVIAFILPRTFQKPLFQNKIDPKFSLIKEITLEKNAFIFNNAPYDVPCVFQVWQKSSENRPFVARILHHTDFVFSTKENANFSFQRVGVRAGTTRSDFVNRSAQSHYFIKDLTDDQSVRRILDKIDWTPIKIRTAGNPSIGKSDLIEAYIKIIKKNSISV